MSQYTPQQIQAAMQRAQAAGDTAAVADLQNRLQQAQATPVAQPPAAQAYDPSWRAGSSSLAHQALGGGAFASGVGDSAIKTYLGLKQFFGGLSPDERGVLAAMDQESAEDPNKWTRAGGNIAGTAASLAVPGGAATRGVMGLVGGAGRLAPYLAGSAVAGATGFATTPVPGQTVGDVLQQKAMAGGQDALMAPLMQGGVNALAKPVTGLFQSLPEAATLFKQGVNPTLQQGAQSMLGRAIGGLTSGMSDVRNRQQNEVSQALLQRSTQGNVNLPGATGNEIRDAVDNYVGGLYDSALQGKVVPISPTLRSNVAQAASAMNKQGQFANEAAQAGGTVGNVMGNSATNINVSPQTLANNYLSPLAEEAYANVPSQVRSRILDARNLLLDARNNRLSPDELNTVNTADSLNFDLNRIREATSGAAGNEEGINLSRLASAYSNKGEDAAAAAGSGNTTLADLIAPVQRIIGTTPRQDESRTMLATAKRISGPAMIAAGAALGGVPGALAGAGAYGLGALGQSAQGAKFLLGQNDWQQALAEALRRAQPQIAGATAVAAPAINSPNQ